MASFLSQPMAHLRAEFAIKDLGPLHYFLGVEVVRRPDGFFLHQWKYAHELLERTDMLNCKPAAMPVDTNAKLSAMDVLLFQMLLSIGLSLVLSSTSL